MKITSEMSISNFEFWSGARNIANQLSYDELDTIESILEDEYPDGMTDTEVNDFFWFEPDTIAEWLCGICDWDAFMKIKKLSGDNDVYYDCNHNEVYTVIDLENEYDNMKSAGELEEYENFEEWLDEITTNGDLELVEY